MVWVRLAVYQFPMRRVVIRRVGLWSLGDGKRLEIRFGMTWETDSKVLCREVMGCRPTRRRLPACYPWLGPGPSGLVGSRLPGLGEVVVRSSPS